MQFTSWLLGCISSCSPGPCGPNDPQKLSNATSHKGSGYRRHSRRNRAASRVAVLERLEDRSLLSVAALFVGGELFVSSDGGDSITIRQNTNSRVEILANGSVLGTAPNVLTSAVTSIVVQGGDDANVIDLNSVTNATYSNITSIRIDGGNGDDVIVGSPSFGDSVLAGDGTDSVSGQGGNDTLDGGDGNDTLQGQDGDDSLIGEDGSDSLSGDAGNDTISGGDHPDTISGGDGNDVVDAGLSGDLVNGDNGNDTLNGMDGSDMLSGDAGDDSILGGAGTDLLLGGDGDDVIDAQAGNDTVHGEAGDDSLAGGTGFDSLAGGVGQDFLNGGANDDTLVGGADHDTELGGAGNDFLYGDEVTPQPASVGNDVLNGQSGNDTVDGGGGNDQLDGGTGNDLLQPNLVDLSASGLSLSVADVTLPTEGTTGITNVTVTVRLSHSSVELVTVDYSTADDTALAGADYQAVNGTLVFAAGQTTRTITVAVRGDILDEADEQFFVALSNANGATITTSQARVTISDDDISPSLPRLSINDVSVTEASFRFAPPAVYGAAGDPTTIASGDFDRDGDLDLATANNASSDVKILLNDGNGQFSPGPTIPVTTSNGLVSVCSIVAVDLDGDGDLDMAVSNSPVGMGNGSAFVSILINNGSGGFALGQEVLTNNGGALTVTAGDIDNDGDNDLVVTNWLGVLSLFVLRNNGDATFAPRVGYPASGNASLRSVALADFNADGFLDAVSGNSTFRGTSDVSIFINNRSGGFGASTTIALANVASSSGLATGDLNGDGAIDITVLDNGNRAIIVLVNDGLGNFSRLPNIALGNFPLSIALADLDGDSDLDAITIGSDGNGVSPRFEVLFNDGSAGLAQIQIASIGGNPTGGFLRFGQERHLVVGDFDRDGDLDFATANGGTNNVSVLLNAGDPQVIANLTVSLSAPSAAPVTFDVATSNGSAVQVSDYRRTTQTVTIAAGNVSQTVSVPIVTDNTDEPNENFLVNLLNPTNATIGDSQGHATIVDDDGGVIAASTLTISDVTLAEGNAGTTNFVFNVTLTRPAGNNSVVTVQYQTADDSATSGGAQPDYTASGPVTLMFAAGVTTQQITIPVNGDVFIETDEAFFVNLLNPVGAILTDSRAVGLIQDDDGGVPTPLVLVNDVLIDEGNSGSVLAVVTLTLSSPAPAAVSISLSTADGSARAGSDYSATTTTINIPLGGTSGTASIPILGDTRDELAEFFTVNLSGVSGGLLTATSLQITLRDDDGPTFSSPNDCVLIGGDGNDTLNAGLGNDTLNGGLGADLLNGGSGNDSILGGAGADTINGEAGNDTINGQGGADQINSGTGDDLLIWEGGVSGKDTLTNESGADGVLVSLNGTNNSVTVAQTPIPLAGTFGFMTITESGVTMTIDSSIDHVTIDGGSGGDTITVADLEKVNQTLLTIRGGEGNDFLTAGLTANTGLVRLRLEGGNGDDTLFGGAGHDTLLGEAGIDRIRGGAGNDQAIGGSGIDSINGEDGNDTLIGGNGSDTLVGDGADSLDGDAGDDSLRGDQGNDLLTGDLGNDTVRGGDGNDTITGDAGNDSLLGDTASDNITGGDGNDTLDGGRNNDVLNGNAGNDKIRGDHGDDSIVAGSGNDTVNGGDGNDVISGQSGADLITGADGNDTVNGGTERDTITGGDGDDSLLGDGGQDVILGEQGDDLINGQADGDTLAGGQGDDTLVAAAAGEIDETFVLSAALLSALNAL